MRFSRLILVLAAALLSLSASVALAQSSFFSAHHVTELDDDSFAPAVGSDNALTYVAFYSRSKCPKCKPLRDTFDRVAKELHGQAVFASVDAADPESAAALAAAGVTAADLPVVKVFSHGHPKEGEKLDASALTAKSLREGVHAQLEKLSRVVKVTNSNFKKLVKDAPADMGKALLFTSKKETMPTWAALSLNMKDRLFVGEVHKSDKKLVKKFDISDFPAIVVIPPTPAGGKFDDQVCVPEHSKIYIHDISEF